jgi:hypothetical protein
MASLIQSWAPLEPTIKKTKNVDVPPGEQCSDPLPPIHVIRPCGTEEKGQHMAGPTTSLIIFH